MQYKLRALFCAGSTVCLSIAPPLSLSVSVCVAAITDHLSAKCRAPAAAGRRSNGDTLFGIDVGGFDVCMHACVCV